VYFFGKMLGAFLGAIMLVKLASRAFFLWTSLASVVAILALIFIPVQMGGMIIMFIIGLSVANIFPLIFSLTVEKYSDRVNEISGLMIMAVSGGAVIPSLILWIFDKIDITTGMFVLVLSAVYLLGLSVFASKKS
jgi:MFS transporter, FHS family, L-fucose permease